MASLAHLRSSVLAVLCLGLGLGLGCYHGFDLEDKEPPPGHAGGVCIQGACYDEVDCYEAFDICYDPGDPCKGIYCGGHGTCGIDADTDMPFCVCDPGYTNEVYPFFCL